MPSAMGVALFVMICDAVGRFGGWEECGTLQDVRASGFWDKQGVWWGYRGQCKNEEPPAPIASQRMLVEGLPPGVDKLDQQKIDEIRHGCTILGPWSVCEGEGESAQEHGPPCLTGIRVLSPMEVGQVLMVGPHDHLLPVAALLVRQHQGKEHAVFNIIIPLHRAKVKKKAQGWGFPSLALRW